MASFNCGRKLSFKSAFAGTAFFYKSTEFTAFLHRVIIIQTGGCGRPFMTLKSRIRSVMRFFIWVAYKSYVKFHMTGITFPAHMHFMSFTTPLHLRDCGVFVKHLTCQDIFTSASHQTSHRHRCALPMASQVDMRRMACDVSVKACNSVVVLNQAPAHPDIPHCLTPKSQSIQDLHADAIIGDVCIVQLPDNSMCFLCGLESYYSPGLPPCTCLRPGIIWLSMRHVLRRQVSLWNALAPVP